MSNLTNSGVFLTVRGTYIPPTLEACRSLHNETAGSERGIAAARSLGDLSHKVYAPLPSPNSSAKAGEVLFVDWWQDPKGLMDFFANENVQMQGAKLFKSRDASVWMPAQGAFSYQLPAPGGKHERFVGLVRGRINSPEAAIEIFRAADSKAQRTARARGLLSHEVFIKLNAPGDTSPHELLGIDVWCDAKGMGAHYSDPGEMKALMGAFAGPPDATTWQQAPGEWSEW
jgi:quinol monooxygenase YgiN